MNKLVMGSVQFGLDYGINNRRGKIPQRETFDILTYASRNGLVFLDTSYAYGDSEIVLGEYIKQSNRKFNIISKLPKNKSGNSKDIFHQSLNRLHTDKLYGYLIHHFDFFLENRNIWCDMRQIKEEGLVEKIGFSLYYPGELDYILDKNIDFDIIQFPFSILDQRFVPYLQKLKEMNKEIHVRSVFLQGLVFKPACELSDRFLKIKSKLDILNKYSDELNTSISSICLNFALLNPLIDRVIIGVDSLENLMENLQGLSHKEKVKMIYSNLISLKEDDENIILPINWK